MAFLDMFLSEEKKIQKNRRRLTSKDSQPEERETAARWLADNGTPRALMALLSRFDMRLDQSLHDKSEKEFTYALLASLGDAVVKPARSWLKQAKSVSIPLRLLEELTDERTALDTVYKLLAAEFARDDFKPVKKHALLVWLAERADGGAFDAAAPFMADFDENVRCTAAEVMIFQNDDRAAAILETAITKEDEDSNRLRHRFAEIFAGRRWPVSDTEAVSKVLPDGFAIREGRVVAG